MQFENEIIASLWNSKTMQHSRFQTARFSNCIVLRKTKPQRMKKHGFEKITEKKPQNKRKTRKRCSPNNGLNKIKLKIIN